MFVLRLLKPHVSTVFHIIHTITAVKYIETNNQPNTQRGMCMFDEDLSLIGGNVIGVEMLKTPTIFGSSVLYHLKELCVDLLDDQSSNNADNILFASKMLKTTNGDLKIDIFSKNNQRANKSRKYIVVMEFCNEEQIVADYKFKFSKREAEIIDGLVQGKNNAQIARTLDLSENTVKTHIKNIYKKTGTCNRAELTYVLMLNK
ncbi:MAG: helix-turn-helix transcriptional regulator [Firmicutes bacterium]|nr:helix-turn-helix transcriptional regulator [Bacillota bacterium]